MTCRQIKFIIFYWKTEKGVGRLTKVRKIRDNDFTSGPILGKLILFALPIMATGLLQTFYNASDMIIVGNFATSGANAMGAVGACTSLINLIINLFTGLAIGAGVLASHHVGAKRYDELKKVVDTSIIASFFSGTVLALIGFVFAGPLLSLMKTPESIIVEAVPYMRAYFIGVPGLMMYNFLSSILRSSGDSKRPLIFLAISGLINVLLNIALVMIFPHKGALNVGIATAVAQYASAAFIFVYMCKADICCKINIKTLKGDKNTFFSIVRIGLPAGIQGMLFSISNVLTQKTVNSYGDITVNGNTASASIESFIYIALNTFYQSTITFVGQNVGAGKYQRIKKIVFQNMALSVSVGAVLGTCAYIFGNSLLKIFAPGAENELVRQAGMNRLMILGMSYFLCGLMEIGCGAVRGMGKAMTPMLVSLSGSCLLRIAWIFAVCPFFPGNISVLYLCYPISWIVTAAAHFICAVIIYKREYKSVLRAKSERILAQNN